jgi:hypothetical protein
MTTPSNRIDVFATTTNDAVDQVRAAARVIAGKLDAGEFGIDALTSSMLVLGDIVARGSAAHLKTAIAGPLFDFGPDETPPSDDIVVQGHDRCARRLSVQVPFRRVGQQSQEIPPQAIAFIPDLLPARATRFSILLKDTHFLGGTYAGTVRLTNHSSDANLQGYLDVGVIVAL